MKELLYTYDFKSMLPLSRSAKDYETAVETWELSMAAGDPEMAQTTTPVF